MSNATRAGCRDAAGDHSPGRGSRFEPTRTLADALAAPGIGRARATSAEDTAGGVATVAGLTDSVSGQHPTENRNATIGRPDQRETRTGSRRRRHRCVATSPHPAIG